MNTERSPPKPYEGGTFQLGAFEVMGLVPGAVFEALGVSVAGYSVAR